MNISFITTVFNEAETVKNFLDSLQQQTVKPKEIIVVDAGSTDATVKVIKNHSLKTKLIVKPSLNRSQARNLAINHAKHNIIAVSDVGCTLDPDWLKRITQPLANKSVDAVAGFYQTEAKTVFQQCLAPFMAVMPDKFNPQTYLPSSRSLAFKKTAWKTVNGYPEKLNYCEDLVFAAKLKQQTNLVVKAEAIVYWQLPTSLISFFQKIRQYAKGDIQARYKPHLVKISTVFLRYLLFAIFPPLFIVYLFSPIFKHYHYINRPLALIWLPLVQLTSDLAIILAVF